mmetsp:Transcript_96287/g.190774  ORF Transcript_96287/g.190774 Transcript_96287/m.190774 type:complete len:206 (+) Transcript_96287:196-813(+)
MIRANNGGNSMSIDTAARWTDPTSMCESCCSCASEFRMDRKATAAPAASTCRNAGARLLEPIDPARVNAACSIGDTSKLLAEASAALHTKRSQRATTASTTGIASDPLPLRTKSASMRPRKPLARSSEFVFNARSVWLQDLLVVLPAHCLAPSTISSHQDCNSDSSSRATAGPGEASKAPRLETASWLTASCMELLLVQSEATML